ncbi:MAG TPA: efflux RND transporter periplasmic adaptor subunit [Candidatus Hydrogenedentes bacterium]|nr:efflux RND transporter periplasmic adaptor subunit [Candidatus Hydrogenedentota bacterium]
MSNLDKELPKLRIDGKKRKRGRGGARWIIVALILAALTGAYFVYQQQHAPIAVRTVRVERQSGAAGGGSAVVTVSGYIIPRQKIEVAPKIIGRVKELLVKRGDKVKEGDVLLRLEDEDLQAQVRSAEAMAGTLQARLSELRAGSRPEEIAAAKAMVASAEATLQSAELDFNRIESLAAKGVVSKQELDRARASRDVARARLDQEKKTAELVKIGPRSEEIAAAEAGLRQAEAQLEYAKTQLDYTVIRAPVSGTILEKLAELGELVTNTNFGGTRGAKTSIVSLADLSDLQVEVDLNENDLAKVHLGQPAEIRLDSAPEKIYKGEVDEISPQADRQKGTVQVKVRMIEPDDSVKIEVTARVTFLSSAVSAETTAETKPRTWIPKGALIRRGNETFVYLAAENAAVLRKIAVGLESDKGVEVTEGLAGTEEVIVEPLEQLRDGARVVVAP